MGVISLNVTACLQCGIRENGNRISPYNMPQRAIIRLDGLPGTVVVYCPIIFFFMINPDHLAGRCNYPGGILPEKDNVLHGQARECSVHFRRGESWRLVMSRLLLRCFAAQHTEKEYPEVRPAHCLQIQPKFPRKQKSRPFRSGFQSFLKKHTYAFTISKPSSFDSVMGMYLSNASSVRISRTVALGWVMMSFWSCFCSSPL